jgi:hypothetical protein
MRTLVTHLSLPLLPPTHRSQETNVLLISDKQLTNPPPPSPPFFLNSFGLKLGDVGVMVRVWIWIWDGAKVGNEKGVILIRIAMCGNQHGGDGIADCEARWSRH